jgi:hypothetical protein
MINLLKKSQLIGVVSLGLLILAAGCSVQKNYQVGSHKVTVSRHGFEKKLTSDEKLGTFEYEGVSTAGTRLKVAITGDKVKVNDRDYGFLRAGDSVFIGDDGVAVNSLDYGESEKYLRANGSDQANATRN